MRLRYSAADPAYPGLLNFGDELNLVIFPEVLPGYFDDHQHPDVDLLGIGTILGMLVPASGPVRRTVVFSSGLGGTSGGYGRPPQSNGELDVVCVRGPLTAEAMGLPRDRGIVDGAVLLRRLVTTPPPPESAPVFVPHLSSVLSGGGAWAQVCDAVGLRYVDPCTGDVWATIEAIRAAPYVVAEAMHAAIVAEAFGVPWVPVASNRTVNEFKWRDWCLSMGHPYTPLRLPRLFDAEHATQEIARRMRWSTSPRALLSVARGLESAVGSRRERAAVEGLRTAMDERHRVVPDEELLDTRLDQLMSALDELKQRYPLG